ncbi:snare-like protein [Piedraia hortae CBS 480.64]|uniref:Trafficking protein particle complex subunit n=1 Tax=Piedraia hortae CBS 480.64 TaxID=1314780 RepID=A0A6A7C090_9PEZI|nr:snare-like protein [Piedraia hortae CBS 480.64]
MSVYALYIFDRHTDCIYSKRWTQPQRPSSANDTKQVNDAKLIFGTVFSLRRIVAQLGGPEDSFLSYRTAEYKLHYFETPTQLKFVMLTDLRVSNMRTVLHEIWARLFVEYVVKSPLVPTGMPGGKGVTNEMFDEGITRFIDGIMSST